MYKKLMMLSIGFCCLSLFASEQQTFTDRRKEYRQPSMKNNLEYQDSSMTEEWNLKAKIEESKQKAKNAVRNLPAGSGIFVHETNKLQEQVCMLALKKDKANEVTRMYAKSDECANDRHEKDFFDRKFALIDDAMNEIYN